MNIKDIIPKDWKIVKLSEITELITKGTTPTTNGYSYLDDGVNFVKVESIHANGTFIPQMFAHVGEDCHNSFKRSQLRNNDILFTIAGALGRSAIVNNEILPANTNQAVAIIRLKNTEYLNYIFHYLRGNYVKNLIEKINVSTAQANLSLGQINQFEIPLPPLPEQKKIAEILSTVDDKIEVIDHQIIETKALKKGLMQRLLTKGIGHTEFKDSPLGEIPKSWEVLEFGDLISSHCYGPRFSSKDYSESGNVKTIRGTDINKTGDILYQKVPTAKLPNDFVENHKLKDGDLVMITTADCGLTGVYFDQGFPFIPSAYAVRIRLNEKAYPFYFKFMFQTELAKNQVEKYIRKGTVANLPGSDILKFTFPTPPFEEQQKIAEILSSVDDKLNVLSEKKNHYQELKQGLMQQLLTGKIQVNGIFN